MIGQAAEFVRGLDEGTQRTEALFADNDGTELVILSDDGDENVEGRDCKHKKVSLEKRSFRSRALPLPLTGANFE